MPDEPQQKHNDQRARTASDVIDQAISENTFGIVLLYVFAAILIIVGLGLVVWAITHGMTIRSVLGLVTTTLCWPAISSIRRTRKENFAIRLLEIPLLTGTTEEACELLQKFFRNTMSMLPDDSVVGNNTAEQLPQDQSRVRVQSVSRSKRRE